MPDARVAVANYVPAWWPTDTRLLIRRARLDSDQISSDPPAHTQTTPEKDTRRSISQIRRSSHRTTRGIGSEVTCLVDFFLVERQFDFPALVVGGGKLERGCQLVVCDRGDEAEQFPTAGPVFDQVLDDPDEDSLSGSRCSPAAAAAGEHRAAAAVDLRVDQQGSVGASGQGGQDRQRQSPRDPPQQRCTGR
jgi:hypothetical protein